MTFCGKFFVSQYQKLRMGTFLCFRSFLLTDNFLNKLGGGCITIFPQKFLSRIPGKKVQESLSASLISGTEKLFA